MHSAAVAAFHCTSDDAGGGVSGDVLRNIAVVAPGDDSVVLGAAGVSDVPLLLLTHQHREGNTVAAWKAAAVVHRKQPRDTQPFPCDDALVVAEGDAAKVSSSAVRTPRTSTMWTTLKRLKRNWTRTEAVWVAPGRLHCCCSILEARVLSALLLHRIFPEWWVSVLGLLLAAPRTAAVVGTVAAEAVAVATGGGADDMDPGHSQRRHTDW